MSAPSFNTLQPSDHLPLPVYDALALAVDSENPLLLEYCKRYLEAGGQTLPPAYQAQQTVLESAVTAGRVLRWLDTPLTPDDAELPAYAVLGGKMERARRQQESLNRGDGYIGYAAVPALNEEGVIGRLISSLSVQVSEEMPLALVVADNNSTDTTPELVRQHGGNVVHAPIPGIGPARQTAINHIIENSPIDLDRTLILQTDADCELEPDYTGAVETAFRTNPELMVGVGPSIYEIPLAEGSTMTIDSGRGYGDAFGTTGLRGYFEDLGRSPEDYLLTAPYRYLPGPNATFRASLFGDFPTVRYPQDKRWETVDFSIRVQRVLDSSRIDYIPGQRVRPSVRAILGNEPHLTATRQEEIRRLGYVPVFKGEGDNTPHASATLAIREIDRETYDLSEERHVVAVVDRSQVGVATDYEVRDALHAGTKEPIVGKVALIGAINQA